MRRILLLTILLLTVLVIGARATSSSRTYIPGVFNEATHTPTPTVTVTPTPTETPFPYGVHILPNSFLYESDGIVHLIGEVFNNTDDSLYAMEIVVEFYGADNRIVGSGSTDVTPLNLPGREKGCFNIIIPDLESDWSYYNFNPPIYDIGYPSSGLVIYGETGFYDSAYGDYNITGWVRNDGSSSSYNVSVGGTLYNAVGIPVGCEYIYVGESDVDLDPGEINPFALNYSGLIRDYYDVHHYRLRVAGDLFSP